MCASTRKYPRHPHSPQHYELPSLVHGSPRLSPLVATRSRDAKFSSRSRSASALLPRRTKTHANRAGRYPDWKNNHRQVGLHVRASVVLATSERRLRRIRLPEVCVPSRQAPTGQNDTNVGGVQPGELPWSPAQAGTPKVPCRAPAAISGRSSIFGSATMEPLLND